MKNIYWWQNALIKFQIKGQPILKVTGEGCQSCDEFNWIGKVIGFERGPIIGDRKECEFIIIQIIKHNNSYSDSRNTEKKKFTNTH